MKLNKLSLHNVGPFLGEHEFDLRTKGNKKPITLIGALNGCGKTTFLEALLLSLYGKRSPSSRCVKSASYDSYLKKLINRDVSVVDGASVELNFEMVTDGMESNYIIRRSWVAASSESKKVTESLEVLVNDTKDNLLTKEWANFIELILPVKLSELFFFDGEQIESLADSDTSNKFLSAAIDELLGIATIKQLGSDLDTLVTRINKSIIEKSQKDCIAEDGETLLDIDKTIKELEKEIDTIESNSIDDKTNKARLVEKLEKLQVILEKNGGRLWEQRASLESERNGYIRDKLHLQENARVISSEALPFIFVRDLIDELISQIQIDESILHDVQFSESIAEYEDKLLDEIADLKLDNLDEIQSLVNKHKESRNSKTIDDVLFGLNIKSNDLVIGHLERKSKARAKEFESIKEEYDLITRQIESIDQELGRIPEGSKITALLKDELELKNAIDSYTKKIDLTIHELDEKNNQKSKDEEKYKLMLSKQAELLQNSDEDNRIRTHVTRVVTTLKRFEKKIHEYRLRDLENNILESLKLIMRKNMLITDIKIHQEDHRIQVFNSKNQLIPPDRLSAGERQLLAVATLWGLAKSTNLNLPVVIDTPLSRLDSTHRTEIVEEYFPAASEQVIILSTDEEIDEKYYPLIESSIENEYLITLDESCSTSRVVNGYWFKEKELVLEN